MRTRLLLLVLAAASLACLAAAVLLYSIPSIREPVSWYAEYYTLKIYRAIYPPEDILFIPQEQVAAIVQATMQARTALPDASPALPTAGASPTVTPGQAATPLPSATPVPSPTPTPTATPLASYVNLTGVRNEIETRNNCGPTTLAMALSYWGWLGDQGTIRSVLRPNPDVDDKNVFPAEMAQYTLNHTNLRALVRVGGDREMLKRLIAAGFPVIVEKGHITTGWIGHYVLLTGYDDGQGHFLSQDSLIKAPDAPVPYSELIDVWWRHFNYLYLVVYPPEREAELISVLGPHADAAYNFQAAADKAVQEAMVVEGRELFFAWYNLGSSRLGLGDTAGAAQAYDTAFGVVYPTVAKEERPWRALWYENGPYLAYYAAGRYQDVINLADTILRNATLEESFYWRGKAREALGDVDGAREDYRRAAEFNPNSTPAMEELERLGGG